MPLTWNILVFYWLPLKWLQCVASEPVCERQGRPICALQSARSKQLLRAPLETLKDGQLGRPPPVLVAAGGPKTGKALGAGEECGPDWPGWGRMPALSFPSSPRPWTRSASAPLSAKWDGPSRLQSHQAAKQENVSAGAWCPAGAWRLLLFSGSWQWVQEGIKTGTCPHTEAGALAWSTGGVKIKNSHNKR